MSKASKACAHVRRASTHGILGDARFRSAPHCTPRCVRRRGKALLVLLQLAAAQLPRRWRTPTSATRRCRRHRSGCRSRRCEKTTRCRCSLRVCLAQHTIARLLRASQTGLHCCAGLLLTPQGPGVAMKVARPPPAGGEAPSGKRAKLGAAAAAAASPAAALAAAGTASPAG